MGKITGFMEFERIEEGYKPVTERLKNYKEFVIGLDDKQAKDQSARCMDCGTPFCNSGCPVNNIIPDFNDLVYQGDWKTALETEAAPLQGSKSSKAKDSKVKGNGDATGAPASSTEYCLRCIHWNGKGAKTSDPPQLGARKGASSNQGDKQGAGVRSAGVRSPFRLANSAPKACEPVSPDDASEVGRLREWMRALKAGSIQWPESVMMCAPADFAACWSDGVALCLLAGALQPLAGRTLLQGWEKRPRTRAHRAHNVRRALSVLGLQAKMHVLHVPILLNNSSVSWHARADSALLSALSNATTGTLRGSQALLSDEAVLDGDASIVLALLRLVRLAYRPP